MSGRRYPHIMGRVFNQPLLLMPQKAQIIGRVLLDHGDLAHADPDGVVVLKDSSLLRESEDAIERDGYIVRGGVAIVDVCGTLVNKLGGCRPYSGMLGYDCIRRNFSEALRDKEVEGILLDIDSPGGEVHGCYDLAEAMFQARGTKPVWAAMDEVCGSAAMWVASVADRVTIAQTGLGGSIGCYYMHVDVSRMLDKAGVEVTYITDDEDEDYHKTDGASEIPLSDSAYEAIQDRVYRTGMLFKEAVARNRALDLDDVIAQKAGVFMGEDAVEQGLADAVMPIDQALQEFQDELT
jgi:ClpP class serine protease